MVIAGKFLTNVTVLFTRTSEGCVHGPQIELGKKARVGGVLEVLPRCPRSRNTSPIPRDPRTHLLLGGLDWFVSSTTSMALV